MELELVPLSDVSIHIQAFCTILLSILYEILLQVTGRGQSCYVLASTMAVAVSVPGKR